MIGGERSDDGALDGWRVAHPAVTTEGDRVSESGVAGAAGTTGSASGKLQDRVQSLRLPAKSNQRAASPLPWILVLLCTGWAGYTTVGGVIPGVPRWLAHTPVQPATGTDADQPSNTTATSTTTAKPAATANAAATPAAAPAGSIVLESKGYIIPEQQILVSPQVSGRVIEINFEAGQAITQGEVLAVLDSTEYRADLERSIAQVAAAQERLDESQRGNRPDEIRQAQADLAEAKTQLDQARRTFERRKELFEQKITTPQDLEDAESEYNRLQQRVEKLAATAQLMIDGPRVERKRIAEAELKAATAELTRAQWRLDNTIIKAPITGTILKKNAELGNLVNPVAFNGSFSLCDIADLSKLEVELDIQERDISKVRVLQKCRVRAEAFPDRFYEGYVSRLMPVANRAKAVIPVRVRLAVPPEEQGQYLKPEMGATVTFYAETVEPPVRRAEAKPVEPLETSASAAPTESASVPLEETPTLSTEPTASDAEPTSGTP